MADGDREDRRVQDVPGEVDGDRDRSAQDGLGDGVAAVDRSILTIASLTPGDPRQVDAYVAGPAALLVAKAIKLVTSRKRR
ncbi:hypothetical protein [Streptomyces chartreusis]|uniref:hypothetical protein n=1 Tax=Streptomyces chartreusis TaxID=1969 RepID=UPI00123D9091|nr:hypothetical protein [Streptomyces chartreusis]